MIIMEISTGYTRCDVCGDGGGIMAVGVDVNGYWYQHNSRCYGDTLVKELTADEAINLLDEHAYLCHTRAAIRARRKLRRGLKARTWDSKITARPTPERISDGLHSRQL